MLSKLKEHNSFGMIATSIMKSTVTKEPEVVAAVPVFTGYVHAAVISALGLIIGFLISFGFGNDGYGGLQKLQLGLMLVLGIASTRYYAGRMSAEKNKIFGQSSKVLLIVALGIFAGLVTIYLLTDKLQWSLAAGSAAIFLLPQIIFEQLKQYNSIPEGRMPLWELPISEIDKRVGISLNSFQLALKLTKDYFSQEEIILTVTEPGRAQLGKLFQRALIQYNTDEVKKIETSDEQKNSYYWNFFVQGLAGRRQLNPELTILENKIRNNAEIIIQRVKK